MFDWFHEHGIELAKTIGFILLSLGFFCALQFTVRWYLFGKWTFRTFSYFKFARKRFKRKNKPLPDSLDIEVVPPNKKWRISNEVVSLIHSSVSGLWALYACLMFPKLIDDMTNFTHEIPKGLVIMSFGYMIHDLIDLLINERSLRIIELLFHHVVVITGFIVTLLTNQFLGVVIFGLLMELNSNYYTTYFSFLGIFLHMRSLLNLYRQPKNSTAYILNFLINLFRFKFIALLNVATYIVFRLAVCIYLIYWQLSNALFMPWYLAIITFVVIASLTITNSVLFYRVLAADGIIGKGRQPKNLPTTSTLTPSNLPEEALQLNNDSYSSGDSDAEVSLEKGKLNNTNPKIGFPIIKRVDESLQTTFISNDRRDSMTQTDDVQKVNAKRVNGTNITSLTKESSDITSITKKIEPINEEKILNVNV